VFLKKHTLTAYNIILDTCAGDSVRGPVARVAGDASVPAAVLVLERAERIVGQAAVVHLGFGRIVASERCDEYVSDSAIKWVRR
jgi:hypothetical protein